MVDLEEGNRSGDINKKIEGATKKSARQVLPALTIHIQSWATPIVGIVMLLVGLLGGYFLRPALNATQPASGGSSSAAAPTEQVRPTTNPTASAQLMEYLVTKVTHYQGDAKAPVTLIEFSDFQ